MGKNAKYGIYKRFIYFRYFNKFGRLSCKMSYTPNSSSPFNGIFDGNGHTISGLWINRANTDYVGLFGYQWGTIKNLSLNNVSIKGNNNVGSFCGYGGTLNNCQVNGYVEGNNNVGGCIGSRGNGFRVISKVDVSGKENVGGICGNYNEGSIGECKVISKYIKGTNIVGGIVGFNHHKIYNCYVYTNIVADSYVGGIVGKKDNGENINKCGFIGSISANSYIGGVAGDICGGNVIGCFAIGHITTKGDYIGGLIGNSTDYSHWFGGRVDYYCSNNVTNSYFSGNVIGNEFVGGLVGYQNKNTVSNCYAYASVTGKKSVGGLVGKMKDLTLVSNSAITLSVRATEGNVGRVYGERSGGTIGAIGTSEENKAYNRAIVVSQGVAQDAVDGEQHGTGVSATTLKLKATYVAMGWDFNDTWCIQETECYPYMKTQTAPPVIQSQVLSGATTVSGKCVDGGTVTLEIDGVKQQIVSTGHVFSFTVSPLQAGHEVRVSAKTDGKEQSYYTTEVVSFLGKGTEADPYQVYTAADLTQVYRKGYYKLMNNIDLTDYINQFSPTEGWQSIGRDGSETIHFDGDGHKVSGLWCNSTRDNTGLFSCFANGEIKNLTVETASGKQVKGGANTGILIGKMINGTIESCHVSGTVADGTPVGGIVGLLNGGSISQSQANVTISPTGATSYVGGIVGEITSGTVDQCVTTGTLTATGSESYVGGIIGKNRATVTNSYSTAKVTSSYNAAGIVAYNYSVVDMCYATGDLYSNNYAAGIIGYNDGTSAVVSNCAAMNNKIEVTYESQQVQQGGGYGQRIIGGIKNGAPAPGMNNYALKTMQVSLNDVPQKVYDDIMNGAAKLGSELMKSNTYKELGWDFSDTWSITEGESYPALKHNEAAVGKADEEPVLSMDEQLEVDEVVASKGKSVSVDIDLKNKATDLSAYQFDLTLPAGFTLAMNGKKYQVTKTARYEDDGQTLNVSAVEGKERTYRFVSFSLSNSVITETSGAILNAIIEVADNVEPGTYGAHITAITFTKADGTQLKLNDTKFNITVNSITLGDVNGDGEVNVADIVEIVNYIMEKPSAIFRQAAADVNGDNEVNVADIVQVVNMILAAGGSNSRLLAPVEVQSTDGDYMTLSNDGELCLDNQGGYVASQFDVKLSHGQRLTGITLDGIRSCGHCMTYTLLGSDTYRVVVYSTDNSPFVGNDGALLKLDVEGCGTVTVDNIVMVTASQEVRRFATMSNQTTGIVSATVSASSADIYTTDGRLVRHQATSTEGLPQGVYIIDGKKKLVK